MVGIFIFYGILLVFTIGTLSLIVDCFYTTDEYIPITTKQKQSMKHQYQDDLILSDDEYDDTFN